MVYLIHFDSPYKHARHYLGYCDEDLAARVERHIKGEGARLLQVVVEAGITFKVVRVWHDGTRDFERSLKSGKRTPLLCPVCNPGGAERLGLPKDGDLKKEATAQERAA